jgi:hypothetical protein
MQQALPANYLVLQTSVDMLENARVVFQEKVSIGSLQLRGRQESVRNTQSLRAAGLAQNY